MTEFKIFSWNFGNDTDEKLECLMSVISKNDNDRIYVIGLQEVSSFQKIVTYVKSKIVKGYKLIFDRKPSSILKIGYASFDLLTIILYPDSVELTSPVWNKMSIPSSDKFTARFADTKGYLWVDFKINGTEYTFVNVHLPFQDENFTASSLRNLFTYFLGKKNVVIFGDYNSRSLIDDTCMPLSKTCDVAFKKNAGKDSLDNMEKTLSSCIEPTGQLKINETTCGDLRKHIIQEDYLMKWKKNTSDFSGYQEAPVDFYPSYKINDKGTYKLTGKKNRLVGLADRIFMKTDETGPVIMMFVPETYRLGECLGNDHYPVEVTIRLIDNKSLKYVSEHPEKLEVVTEPLLGNTYFYYKDAILQKDILEKNSIVRRHGDPKLIVRRFKFENKDRVYAPNTILNLKEVRGGEKKSTRRKNHKKIHKITRTNKN